MTLSDLPAPRQLYTLADAYAPQAWANPDLRRFEVLVITDQNRRCGLWVWLNDASAFTREEREYLAGQHLGRIATVGPDGQRFQLPRGNASTVYSGDVLLCRFLPQFSSFA
jgi:hypothetical protein